MYFKHYFESGLAQNSYMVACQASGEAIVIDPRRDIEPYLATAKAEGFTITKVTETHIHADYLSGSRELAAATKADLLLSEEGGPDWLYAFPHTGLRDGDEILLGNLKLTVLHTPGHTPEHVCFLLFDLPSSSEPVMLFTGDFLFVGDVGRPDLLEEAAGIAGSTEVGARDMFRSLRRLTELPDYVQVWPGHGAGSACGKSLGAVPSTTIGYEKARNWALAVEEEPRFVTALLDGQPEPPSYFATMKKLNRSGPPVLNHLPTPSELTPREVAEAREAGAQVVDSRSRQAFVGGHIPGSIGIPDDDAFSNWAGWLLEYDRPIVLLADRDLVPLLVVRLVRIGLDNVVGYFSDFDSWVDAGYPVATTNQIDATTLSADTSSRFVLDVRGRSEYDEGHIEGAHNIHVGHLRSRSAEVPKDQEVVVHCLGGYRSVIACGVLEQLGYTNITNLMGGYAAWEMAVAGRSATTGK